MIILLLLACGASDDTGLDTTDTGGNSCLDPTAAITSPLDGDVFTMGDDVTLTADAVSSQSDDLSGLELLWAIEDDVLADHGPDAHWIADLPGQVLIRFQITDDCGVAQDAVTITVNK